MTALRIHGGRIDLAALHYPHAPRPWLDLSTGINPNPWVPAAPLIVDPSALPSPACILELEVAAADAFGTCADRVMALPGSEIGLRSLASLGLPSPARFVVPSYGTHASALPDATPIARSAIDTVIDGTLLLANPNNPDGHLDKPERLLAIARQGASLIVDEAFADIVPEGSIVPHLQPDDPVIVLRSFGKMYGLAGLRLGFMIASPDRIAAMRNRLGSWPVSAHAIAYGLAAYRDSDWLADARQSIAARATRLDAILLRHGLEATGDCPLFRLVDTDASAVFERLARAGILTRPFDYAPRWLRIGVPADDAAFDRLDHALARG
ncbi:threonine-phosphate decarboxylase [Sphingomonas sp. 4RDLI-65]|uniref:threonine-phosphate decarboxylase n=1 Tax=Sphingomonas sp. 4RDLI-65 TaxID=3111641 RepID=UPI003C2D8FF2